MATTVYWHENENIRYRNRQLCALAQHTLNKACVKSLEARQQLEKIRAILESGNYSDEEAENLSTQLFVEEEIFRRCLQEEIQAEARLHWQLSWSHLVSQIQKSEA